MCKISKWLDRYNMKYRELKSGEIWSYDILALNETLPIIVWRNVSKWNMTYWDIRDPNHCFGWNHNCGCKFIDAHKPLMFCSVKHCLHWLQNYLKSIPWWKLNSISMFARFDRNDQPSHKSHNALGRCPIMRHIVTEMCTHVHISVTKWCIVGYLSNALWDLWDGRRRGQLLLKWP